MEDMTIKQIAEKMKCPIRTVRAIAAAEGILGNVNVILNNANQEWLLWEIEGRQMGGGDLTAAEISCEIVFLFSELARAVAKESIDDVNKTSKRNFEEGFNEVFSRMTPDDKKDTTLSRFIYFIQEGDNGPIKIGSTRNLKSRLPSLQTGSAKKLRVLGTMRGGNALESLLHQGFAEYRISGEWFQPGQTLLKFIAEEFGGYEITDEHE